MYKNSIVTFIDILGFKNIVETRSYDEISILLNVLNDFGSSGSDNYDDSEATLISFSDSIIRIRNLETEQNLGFPIGHLFWEVNSLVHIQMNLANNGVLIRGGVSIGDVSASENRVFGPAFVKAYELESQFAHSPRIIVAPELVNSIDTNFLVRNENHTADEEREYLRQILRKGDDGIFFVDYLLAAEHEADDPSQYALFLERHKKLIVDEGMKHSSLSNISSKYLWLGNYHNSIVSSLPESLFSVFDMEKEDLLISYEEMETLTRL